MSSGLLDFFTLEASEYVEHLDGLIARAHGGTPDLEGCLRSARALRGSATMAKIGGIADVAGAMERVGHALQSGALSWSDALRGAWVAAIDDLKILIRGVRSWSEADTTRAAARAHELAEFAPAASGAGAAAPNASVFLATECAEVAHALADFADNPVGPAAFAGALQRVRGLRGIALLRDLPPLPEIVDALDQAAKTFELGGAVTPALRALFTSAAAVLADGSIALQRGDRPSTASSAITAFAAAAAAFGGGPSAADDIVPISSLFPDDGQPGIVSAAPTPPTTASQRFRLEVVSHAEHLRRLIGDAARATDGATRERLSRELGAATRALSRMAASFGESSLATFFDEQQGQAALLAGLALNLLDAACQLLSAPHGRSTAEIVRAVRPQQPTPVAHAAVAPVVAAALAAHAAVPIESLAPDDVVPIESLAPDGVESLASAAPDGVVPIASLAPDGEASLVSSTALPAVTAPPAATSHGPRSGDALNTMLERGLAGLSGLESAPLAEPAALDEDVTVPIEDLVYRGRDALDRAIELRDLIRQSPDAPDPEMLAELFDLLELAATAD